MLHVNYLIYIKNWVTFSPSWSQDYTCQEFGEDLTNTVGQVWKSMFHQKNQSINNNNNLKNR